MDVQVWKKNLTKHVANGKSHSERFEAKGVHWNLSVEELPGEFECNGKYSYTIVKIEGVVPVGKSSKFTIVAEIGGIPDAVRFDYNASTEGEGVERHCDDIVLSCRWGKDGLVLKAIQS